MAELHTWEAGPPSQRPPRHHKLNATLLTGRQSARDARQFAHHCPRAEFDTACLSLDNAPADFAKPRFAFQLRARRFTRFLKRVGQREPFRLGECQNRR